MTAKKTFKNENTMGWVMKLIKIPLLLLIILAVAGGPAMSQIISDPDYKIIVQGFQGQPGDTVWMPIWMKNYDTTHAGVDGSIGGFVIRLEYHQESNWETTPLIMPLIDYADTNAAGDTTYINYKRRFSGRGHQMALIDTSFNITPGWDTTYPVFAFHEPPEDHFSDVMFIQFLPTEYDTLTHLRRPVIDASPDSSLIMEIPFVVQETGIDNASTAVRPRNDQFGDLRINQFTDGSGTAYIEPITVAGYFQVGNPLNNNPVVTVPQSTYTVQPGVELSFTVTGSDQDGGDLLTLSALNMPTGATFDTEDGQSSVSGTFTWTPTAGDAGSHVVDFRIIDTPGATDTKSVTINVGTTDNDPPIVSIPTSVYTVSQGENINFTVSASDADGDEVCLEVVSGTLPPGASFEPVNPCGTGSTSGTFNWTTNFSSSGTFGVSFRATDDGGLSDTKTVNITVNEPEYDRLYTTSVYGDYPVGGIAGATPVEFPINLISRQSVYGIQFKMYYPGAIATLDSFAVTDRMPEYIVYDNINEHPDTVLVVAFGLNSEPVVDGATSAIMNAYFSMDSLAEWGDYWVHFDSARESIDPDFSVPSKPLVIDSGIIQIDRMGDVNLDRYIDVDDAVKVVYSILGHTVFPKRNYECANVVIDTLVNVVDLVGITNMIFDRPIEPSPAPSNFDGELATLDVEHEDLFSGQLTKLNVRGEFPDDVAGLQMQIDYDPNAIQFMPPELSEEAGDFTLVSNDDQNGRMKILLYTFSSSTIKAGAADLVRLPAITREDISADDDTKFRISQIYLSNPLASEIPVERDEPLLPTSFTLHQNYPNPFNPDTRIDFEIGHNGSATQHVRLNVFNILGRQVKTLVDEDMSSGHHTVIWNATDNNGKQVATGIYLYRLEVGDRAESKKMLLLK